MKISKNLIASAIPTEELRALSGLSGSEATPKDGYYL
jgi:hypothetical protein